MNRREFLGSSLVAGFPAIVPSTVFGQSAASNILTIGQIGCGRIARASEFPGLFRNVDSARIVAVSDLDTIRLQDAKELVEARSKSSGVKTFRDYREMLADKSIDAVCISTPDHWHAQPAMEAALAGKDIYLQKPASLTIREGRQMADCLKQTGRILQIGSQQRSDPNFRLAAELVRNGRIGQLREIFIGLPEDPAGPEGEEMPVPRNLDYEAWLGSTPSAYYTENRVHPQSPDPRKRYDRPGWLRCEQFGAGMITGWGAHHIDIAHWAMDTELSGPVEVSATAEFPKKGLWDVHGPYHAAAKYANGVTMYISEKYPNGIRFLGDEGWIWVTRKGGPMKPIDASDKRWIEAGVKESEVRLHASPRDDHHYDWLQAIRTRKQPSAPVEVGHRSCSACLVAHAAMKLNRKLLWDPATEQFVNDAEANATLARPQRKPWGTDYIQRG